MENKKQNSSDRLSKLSRIDGDLWATRSLFWLSKEFKPARTKISPRRSHAPLIITGHGAGLFVRNGALLVRDGYTHYPQKRAEYFFFPRDPNMPSRIVIVDGTGSLSFAAMGWLNTQNVPLMRINWRGNFQSMIGGLGYSADPKKVAMQQQAKLRALEISTELIKTKIINAIGTLRLCLPSSKKLDVSVSKLEGIYLNLTRGTATTRSSLLGIEGTAAIVYFDAWQGFPLQWKGTGRRPVPSDWLQIGPRSSVVRLKIRNRHAGHPVNAMLNYAYAILESYVQREIVAAGLDPAISFLHIERSERPALIFDLMEPLRPIVDRAVLSFVRETTFVPSDFTLRADGVCRLNPQLARNLIKIVPTAMPELFASKALEAFSKDRQKSKKENRGQAHLRLPSIGNSARRSS